MINAYEQDVGLGTAYERYAIYRLFDRWFADRPVKTGFEGPADGMAGIPGLHLVGLAHRGLRATVALPDASMLERVEGVYQTLGLKERLEMRPLAVGKWPEDEFDIAVCYNALPAVDDWQRYLRGFFSVKARYFVVVVSNPRSYGVYLRRLQRRATFERKVELFDHEVTHREVIEPELGRYGTILAHDYLDCPWWPDFLIPAGGNIAGQLLARLRGNRPERREQSAGLVFGPGNYPYFEGQPGYAPLHAMLARHPTFDRAPEPVARSFGHLHGYLVERRSA